MTLAERSTHWSTVFKPKSNNPIGRGTGHDEQTDARERRSRANWWLTINRRRPVIGNVRPKQMKRSQTFLLAFAITLTIEWVAKGADPAESLLRELPAGVAVESSVEIPAAQTKAIGQKLGGEIQWLTNSVIRVHGRSIQVNAITAIDESNAEAIHAGLRRSSRIRSAREKGTSSSNTSARTSTPLLPSRLRTSWGCSQSRTPFATA